MTLEILSVNITAGLTVTAFKVRTITFDVVEDILMLTQELCGVFLE